MGEFWDGTEDVSYCHNLWSAIRLTRKDHGCVLLGSVPVVFLRNSEIFLLSTRRKNSGEEKAAIMRREKRDEKDEEKKDCGVGSCSLGADECGECICCK